MLALVLAWADKGVTGLCSLRQIVSYFELYLNSINKVSVVKEPTRICSSLQWGLRGVVLPLAES